jgi:hypothetical protein
MKLLLCVLISVAALVFALGCWALWMVVRGFVRGLKRYESDTK